jgi:hypothetical protein
MICYVVSKRKIERVLFKSYKSDDVIFYEDWSGNVCEAHVRNVHFNFEDAATHFKTVSGKEDFISQLVN